MPLCGRGRLWGESAENAGSCSPLNLAWGRSRASGQLIRGCGGRTGSLASRCDWPWGQQFRAPADLQGPKLLFSGCLLGGSSEASTGTACKNAGCQAVSCLWGCSASNFPPWTQLMAQPWLVEKEWDSIHREEGGKEVLGRKSWLPLAAPERALPDHLADLSCVLPGSSFRLSRGRRARRRPACSTQGCPSSMRGKHHGHLGCPSSSKSLSTAVMPTAGDGLLWDPASSTPLLPTPCWPVWGCRVNQVRCLRL